ncbi:hypothetical protein A2V71_02360 [Candidatus Berkelbacteria bacterium RBG_13_40_8]|uniref:Transcriptional repressor PaaX-like central Cas2-like domain-containing protein n=1 Tax=Candidatus Berkelbacteria bacterium RBG_13_40_8 TaxID=1797467 RepID=A0A1F5DMZ2_9BACT|nr:MAG: hypothetical protein A2V71_02360 [Candidatus Berkelbacteria bacterium RBG_13_40_8]
MNRKKIGLNEREIIKYIGFGALVLIALTSPSPKLPKAILKIIQEKGPGYLSKMLKKLENKNVIYLGGEKVRLTKRGRELFKLINLQNMEILKPKKWDKIWRLVSYDIPDISKKKRDWFRETLENLDFEKIQESLYVYPHECKEEIAVIARNLGVTSEVLYMTTDHLPSQEKMVNKFGLE